MPRPSKEIAAKVVLLIETIGDLGELGYFTCEQLTLIEHVTLKLETTDSVIRQYTVKMNGGNGYHIERTQRKEVDDSVLSTPSRVKTESPASSTTSIAVIGNVEAKAEQSITTVEQPVERAVEEYVSDVVEDHLVAATAIEIVADEAGQSTIVEKPAEHLVEDHVTESQVAEEQAATTAIEIVADQFGQSEVVEKSSLDQQVAEEHEEHVTEKQQAVEEHSIEQHVVEDQAVEEPTAEELTISQIDGAIGIVPQQVRQSDLQPITENEPTTEAVTITESSSPPPTRKMDIGTSTAAWNEWSKKNVAEHPKLMLNTPGSMENYAKVHAEAQKIVALTPPVAPKPYVPRVWRGMRTKFVSPGPKTTGGRDISFLTSARMAPEKYEWRLTRHHSGMVVQASYHQKGSRGGFLRIEQYERIVVLAEKGNGDYLIKKVSGEEGLAKIYCVEMNADSALSYAAQIGDESSSILSSRSDGCITPPRSPPRSPPRVLSPPAAPVVHPPGWIAPHLRHVTEGPLPVQENVEVEVVQRMRWVDSLNADGTITTKSATVVN